jgi:dTDP-4-amino-4,6-dideoxygalactose transaminase
MNPHQVTRDFEKSLCAYTGAPHAVAVTSCTMALLLAVSWNIKEARRTGKWTPPMPPDVQIPKRTYVSVPMSIIHAGGRPTFRDEAWVGAYQLKPLPVWDSARWFTSGIYTRFANKPGRMICLSFHAVKTLGDTQGGAILLDDPDAAVWLRRARFDGRTEGVAPKDLSPDVAARLLWQLSALPRDNDPLPNDDYPDLSEMEIFR